MVVSVFTIEDVIRDVLANGFPAKIDDDLTKKPADVLKINGGDGGLGTFMLVLEKIEHKFKTKKGPWPTPLPGVGGQPFEKAYLYQPWESLAAYLADYI